VVEFVIVFDKPVMVSWAEQRLRGTFEDKMTWMTLSVQGFAEPWLMKCVCSTALMTLSGLVPLETLSGEPPKAMGGTPGLRVLEEKPVQLPWASDPVEELVVISTLSPKQKVEILRNTSAASCSFDGFWRSKLRTYRFPAMVSPTTAITRSPVSRFQVPNPANTPFDPRSVTAMDPDAGPAMGTAV